MAKKRRRQRVAYFPRDLVPTQLPPEIWNLAKERTNALLDRVRFFDGDLGRMLANAYVQGVTDVTANFNISKMGAALK